MKFNTVSEAFNFYKDQTTELIESRAKAINSLIESDPKADLEALNTELRGMDQAKAEILEKRSKKQPTKFNFIEGTESGKGEEPESAADSKEYRNAFYKHLKGEKLTEPEKNVFNQVITETRAETATLSSDAAALLPTSTLNEVVSKAHKIGGLISEARAFNMPSKISIPVVTPATGAEWHAEGSTVNPEKIVPESVIFESNELIKIFSLSAKVKTMSIPAFESYLTTELTNSIMLTLGNSLVNGTGIGQGKGLESETINTITAAKSGIAYKDVIKTVASLERGYAMGAKFAMNNAALYNVFYGMTTTDGKPIFIADPKAESIGKILGFDVVIDDNIPDNVIYLGNFNSYLGYNLPNGIAIETSTQSSFRQGLIDYRALAVADTRVILPDAFVKLTVAAE